MAYVYILRSLKTGKYYTGSTEDLVRRLKDHNSGNGGKFSSLHKPWELVCYKYFSKISESRDFEKVIKNYKAGQAFKKIIENMEGWQSGRLHQS